jgi:septal ring factor EnvC (AmiA/AmiB activator)
MKEKLRKEIEEVGQKMGKEKSSKESLELEKKLKRIREEIKDVDRIIKS